MMVARSHILTILLVLACELPVWAQAPAVSDQVETAPGAEISQELALIRDQLLNNKDSSTRISAASVLLFRDEPVARSLVLDALKQTANPPAREAVCRALDRSRTDSRVLKNKEDFLQPLIDILGTEEDPRIAHVAAEATLMFSYDQVQAGLEAIADDTELPVTIRSNAVYTLQLHPDKRAVLKLIALLDDPDSGVATIAGEALSSLGISLPNDAEGRRRAVSMLEQQGPEIYLRKRLVRSEADIRTLKAGMLQWQDYLRSILDEWYGSLADVAAKSAFLAERLKTPEPEIRLWALGRLEELVRGTGKLKLSEEMEKTLLSLVSSRNRQVRLRTAQILTRMGELNSTQRLLQQLNVEEDAEVRHELFVALGGACYYASLPTSPFRVPEEARKETLEWAVKFLNEQRAETVQSGADVIRKLLTQDGLTPEELDTYLAALARRYQQATAQANHALRGELLNDMAQLCISRPQATARYSPIFEQALGDAAEPVRQAALEGFINIDATAALKKLGRAMADDPSAAIRARLISLAGDVGTGDDLDWLSQKLDIPGEGEQAWQAMLKIFGRSGIDTIAAWVAPSTTPPLQERLSPERKKAFFLLVEQQAQSSGRTDLLTEARRKLVALCTASGDFQKAAECLRQLEDAATNQQEKESLLSARLDVCLRWPNLEMAGEIVNSYLLRHDLSADSPMAKSIEAFLAEPPSGVDPNALLEKLNMIRVKEPEARLGWRELLQRWSKPVARIPESTESEGISN
jgi:HEAT repeat protein